MEGACTVGNQRQLAPHNCTHLETLQYPPAPHPTYGPNAMGLTPAYEETGSTVPIENDSLQYSPFSFGEEHSSSPMGEQRDDASFMEESLPEENHRLLGTDHWPLPKTGALALTAHATAQYSQSHIGYPATIRSHHHLSSPQASTLPLHPNLGPFLNNHTLPSQSLTPHYQAYGSPFPPPIADYSSFSNPPPYTYSYIPIPPAKQRHTTQLRRPLTFPTSGLQSVSLRNAYPPIHTNNSQNTQQPIATPAVVNAPPKVTEPGEPRVLNQISLRQALILFLHSPERVCANSRLLPYIVRFYSSLKMRDYTISCANKSTEHLTSQDLLTLYKAADLNTHGIMQIIETFLCVHSFEDSKCFDFCAHLLQTTSLPVSKIAQYAYILSTVDPETISGREILKRYDQGTLKDAYRRISSLVFPSKVMNTLIHKHTDNYFKEAISQFNHKGPCCLVIPSDANKAVFKEKILEDDKTSDLLSNLLLQSTLTPGCASNSAAIAVDQIIYTGNTVPIIQRLGNIHSIPHTNVSDILADLKKKASKHDPYSHNESILLLGELTHLTWTTKKTMGQRSMLPNRILITR